MVLLSSPLSLNSYINCGPDHSVRTVVRDITELKKQCSVLGINYNNYDIVRPI